MIVAGSDLCGGLGWLAREWQCFGNEPGHSPGFDKHTRVVYTHTQTHTHTKGYNKEKFQDWWFEQDRDYFIHSLRSLSSEISSLSPSLTFLSGRTLTRYICIIWVRRILHTTKSKWEHNLETAGTCEAHLCIYCHSTVLYFLQDVTLRNVHCLNTRQYLRTALFQLCIVYLATKHVKTNKIPSHKSTPTTEYLAVQKKYRYCNNIKWL